MIIDPKEVTLDRLITHQVGNKQREEELLLAEEETDIEDETLNYLLEYFLSPFKTEEFYCFSHAVDLNLNEVYTVVKAIFAEPDAYIKHSQSLAKMLYESSMHPNIKDGQLNVAVFKDIKYRGQIVDAVGIFKSETEEPFIQMDMQKERFSIKHELGYELKGIDKSCIIFNLEEENGYKVQIADSTNRSAEAQYWKDDFLQLKPLNDDYHQTKQFLSITKNFVTQQLNKEFEVSRADEIDFLNRSVEYFKTHEKFDKHEFEENVFYSEPVIESFRKFDEDYRREHEVEYESNFGISVQAVKKQSKVFKSVLKLDKNFHVYIHGNRELIEQGMDENGRKYYKLYYEEES